MEKIVLKNLSDGQLLEIAEELQKDSFEAGSIVRRLSIQTFGNDDLMSIFGLNGVLLPIIAERLKCCSPHIEK